MEHFFMPCPALCPALFRPALPWKQRISFIFALPCPEGRAGQDRASKTILIDKINNSTKKLYNYFQIVFSRFIYMLSIKYRN